MLGTGSISIYHMRAWQAIPGVQIVALANRTRSKAVDLGRQFGVEDAHIYADYHELLDKERLDFVDVATAPDIHRQQVLAAAEHGVNVFCQKPFATSMAEAEEMIAACERAGVRCIVNENWRWRRWYRELKRMLDEGVVGKPRYARFLSHSASVLPRPDGSQPGVLIKQSYMATMPKLILFEWGIHLVDVLRFLFGDVARVYARMSRVSPIVVGEDMALVVLEFRSGLTGLIDISYGTFTPEGRRLPRAHVDFFVVEGDKGTIEFEPYQDDTILITTAAGTEQRAARGDIDRPTAYQESYIKTHSHFIHCLRAGEPAENEGRDNLKTLAIMFAAYEAAERGQIISLPS